MAKTNIREFQADLERFSKQLKVDLEVIIRKIAIDLLTKIVLRTPVDTGRARASWNLSAGEPDESTAPDGVRLSASTAAALALSTRKNVQNAKPFSELIWITNGLPYILALEYGHSRQAPAGMVEVSIAELEAELQAEIDRRG
jgi:hypothetical protein